MIWLMIIVLPVLGIFVAGIVAGALQQRAGYDRDRHTTQTPSGNDDGP